MPKIEDQDLQRFFDKINSGPGGVKQPEPAFQRYRKSFLRDFDWNSIKRYAPEQIIQSARTQEELIIIGEFLQKEWGRDHWWWKLYHYKRIQLGYLPSLYGVTKIGTPEMKTVWGAPVNPQEYLRYKNLSGPQATAVERRMFPKLLSYQQLTGEKPAFSVVDTPTGPQLKGWVPIKRPKLPSNLPSNIMVFDLEATGLLNKDARIVSMGLQDLEGNAKSWFAEFDQSKKHAEFIEDVILPQWKKASAGKTILTEKQLIEKAISSFENAESVMGYNIKSYDIPLLYERSKAYGLHTRFEKAVTAAKVLDVAEHAQAFISSQVGGKYLGWQQGELGLKPLGWKLETVAESLGYQAKGLAHEASEDVTMTRFVWDRLKSKKNIKESAKIFQKAIASGFFEESVYKHTGKRLLPFKSGMGTVNFAAQMLPEEEYVKPFGQYISSLYGEAPKKVVAKAAPEINNIGFIGKLANSKVGKGTGAVLRYGATFTAMNLILPGDFASNAASSLFFDVARYAAKRRGVTGWKQFAIGAAGAGVFRLGKIAYTEYKEQDKSELEQIRTRFGEMSNLTQIDLKKRKTLKTKAESLFGQETENVKAEFNWFKEALEEYGQTSGTGHKRIMIPKEIINEEELEKKLGFMEVDIAIPEAGQVRSESFRHPQLKYHLHDFGDVWTMHEDKHHSSTMMIERAKRAGKDSILEEAFYTLKGLPHVVTEGIPGLFYYLKGQITDTPSMKERLEEELSPSYLQLVGLKEAPKSQRFSGFDDDYNTIPGFSESGLAAQQRHSLTEFGSGWKPFKAVAKRMYKEAKKASAIIKERAGEKEILNGFSTAQIKEYSRLAKKSTVEEFAEHLGVSIVKDSSPQQDYAFGVFGGALNVHKPSYFKDRPKNVINAVKELNSYGFEEGKAYINLDLTTSILSNLTETKDPRIRDSLLKTTIFHEAAEVRNAKALGSRGFSLEEVSKEVLPHQLTLPQEELFVRLLGGKKHHSFFKKLREKTDPMFQGYIPGRDDAYNTIEGLRHGGLAEKMRKILTEFGSGWDPLKAVAKRMYKNIGEKEAFKRLRRSEVFKSALKEAVEVKELSSGSFGTTYLMEGAIKGEKFKFVKKLPESELSEQFAAFNPNVPDRPKRIAALKKEHKAMPFVEEKISPSVYGYDKEENALFMELMPGKTIHELLQEGKEVDLGELRKTIKDAIKETTKKGIKNTDIHTGNIMLDPETRKLSWIDWGLAERNAKPTQEWIQKSRKEMEEAAERKLLSVVEQSSNKRSSAKEASFFEVPKTAFNSLAFNKTIPIEHSLEVRKQQIKRMSNFNKSARAAVGIGHRAAKNAGKKHRQFGSIRRG